MRKHLYKSGVVLGLALVCSAAPAATDDVLTLLSEVQTYGFIVDYLTGGNRYMP